jgi:signal transduction histidine kinase
VETFEDGLQGVEGVSRLRPGLVVVDLKMPGVSGLEVIARVHEMDPLAVVVVITGYATIDTAVEAMKAGAYDFLPKPFSPEELRLIVNRGLERRRLLLETRHGEMERELLKRRFVTFVSHQLQTPLAAVHQYLSVLKQFEDLGEIEAKRREWIERCLKRSEEMQALIRDWLTLARLESDRLARPPVRVELGQIIGNILATYEPTAAAERVTLEAQVPEQGCWVKGDPNCLNVLLDNLIVNAIKYNRPEGRVTVSAAQEGEEVALAVVDTGVGISPEHRQFLFEEFFRVRGEGVKKTPGTGLGLAICRRIVTELGGSIKVESEPGTGSTFRVRLPAWREPAAEAGGSESTP